ncbi:MAG TPA: sugar ABC transporter permease [Clostridiales bacterium]|nr:sugar ABC transporter permease [Clostridiales bacterium]
MQAKRRDGLNQIYQKKEVIEDSFFKGRASKSRASGNKVLKNRLSKDDREAYIMISPFFIFFVLFVLVPITVNFVNSFTNYNLGKTRGFVGLENYIKLFVDRDFLRSLWNTLIYAAFSVIPLTVLGFITAVAVNGRAKIFYITRALFVFPYVTSMVAVSMIWLYMYEPTTGVFNKILISLGFEPLKWLFDEKLALLCLIIMNIWKNIGYVMIIYLAGLQSIPENLYEAGKVDGASEFKMLFKITIPMVRSISFFIFVTTSIESFKTFEQVRIMTGGGPVNSTTTIVHQIYLRAFSEYKMGYASAISIVLLIIIFAITMMNMKLGKGKGQNDEI